MPLHLGMSHGHQQETARQLRRDLQQKVCNDWSYPDAPHPDTHSSGDARAVVTAHVTESTNGHDNTFDFEPITWREREYSENETTGDEDEPQTSTSTTAATILRSRSKRKTKSSESVEEATERNQARKRRRKARLEEEMSWNIGLAHFSAQRNAWTGARVIPDHETKVDNSVSSKASDGASRSSDGSSQRSDIHSTRHDDIPGTVAVAEDATVSIPVAPRLLPDHPIRAKIGSSSYGEIYSKIVVQGRTPSIPVNLQDMTNALVHGWKEEGNWPPQVALSEPSVGRKKEGEAVGQAKHPHFTKGVKVIGRVFHGLTGGPMDAPRI